MGKETAVRLLNAATSGFKEVALHDGYIQRLRMVANIYFQLPQGTN
jgi:hypothetical protein